MSGFIVAVVNSIVFSIIGVVVFWVSFVLIDTLTPSNLWKELSEDRNTALAIAQMRRADA